MAAKKTKDGSFQIVKSEKNADFKVIDKTTIEQFFICSPDAGNYEILPELYESVDAANDAILTLVTPE